jgi:glycosyltransferase involved in cell wall biosynthesis
MKKRILFIIEMLDNGGGAERVASRLVNELSKRHQVYLMYFRNGDKPYYISPQVRLIKPDDNTTSQTPSITSHKNMFLWHLKNYFSVFSKVLNVKRVKREHQIDTTISFLKLGNVVNVLARGKDKIIVSERFDPSKMDTVYRISVSFANHFADHVVFQSKRVRDMYCEKIQKKSSVIVNPTEVNCEVKTLRAKKIVAVGRLTAQKNHKLLIRAFAMFHATHQEHHLHIFGEGELLEELHQTAEECDVKSFVHFEGFKNDIHAAIADAEQFVVSSDFEGLSNALMEAMMMGHACISTDCAGSDELIENEITGLLVPVGNVKALCEAMCRLSDDFELRKRLGRAAAVVARAWDTESVIPSWERIL